MIEANGLILMNILVWGTIVIIIVWLGKELNK